MWYVIGGIAIVFGLLLWALDIRKRWKEMTK